MTQRRLFTALIALAITLTLAAPAWADGPSAVAWLKTQQNADGGFGSPSTIGATADAVLAVAAGGENALAWGAPGATALDFIKTHIDAVTKAGEFAKVVLALTANGQNPRSALGDDLIARLESMLGADGRIGGDGDFVNEHCMAVLALSSANRAIPARAVNYLLAIQLAGGAWAWNADTTPGSGDNNTTALAVVALIAAGVPADHAQIQKAIAHFKGQQNQDGGFPYIKPSPWGDDSDSNSTAVVSWALLAAGEDPAGVDWKIFAQDGASAYDRLRAFQNDSGAFRWQDAAPGDNFMSTVQALIALEMKTLPLARIDVGAPATIPANAAPETLPQTGGAPWPAALLLIAAGATLIAAGRKLRRCA